jgi:uncharacterized membrane protein
MDSLSLHYFPLAFPFLLLMFLLFILLVFLIEIRILGYAYERIGIDRRYIFGLLLLSFFGSYVNIPVAQLPAEEVQSGQIMTFFGMQYVVPMVREWPRTIIAVNLGGAIIPTVLSLYLMLKNRLYGRTLLAVGIVTVIVHMMAHPVRGVGIAVPTFTPPLAAAGVALALSRRYAPILAYIAGSLGTLIGADLLNLGKIRGLGAPVASIGGAGTFDGIFVTGIVAVLLAGIMTRRRTT